MCIRDRRSTLNKHNNSGRKSEPTSKQAKPRGPIRRDTKDVLAELVGKLKEKLDPKKLAATSAGEKHKRGELRPNLDRLTVGVDLGDQWSHYCILDLEAVSYTHLNTHSLTLGCKFKSIGGILHALFRIPRCHFAQGSILPPDRRVFLAVSSDGGFC